jgi:hypothetical protein
MILSRIPNHQTGTEEPFPWGADSLLPLPRGPGDRELSPVGRRLSDHTGLGLTKGA